MLATLLSAAIFGIEAYRVQVEVDVSNGLPSFTMVGLPDPSVRESRDRVRSAIRNAGFEFPAQRITVNLAPADVRKGGSWFDLPVALGILAATGVLTRRHIDDLTVLGELSLDGAIQPVRGVLPVAVAARRHRSPHLVVPIANAAEAAVVAALRVHGVATLSEAVAACNSPDQAPTAACSSALTVPTAEGGDWSDIKGQPLARRALEVAAAGGHNILMVGPPGAGKTMMARRLPTILPPLTFDETIEVTTIHSVAGLLPPGAGLLPHRPFRAPHHTASDVALVGGGGIPRPGEISLAHRGVLFLDELPEFDRHVVEALRQPIEDGNVTLARAARTVSFPARFMLVAAMNPCPCGHAGQPSGPACRCTPAEVERYRGRLSGPMLDRIDLAIEVPAVPVALLGGDGHHGEPSAAVRERVCRARSRQLARAAVTGRFSNARLQGRTLWRVARPTSEALGILESAASRLDLSARAYDRVLRVGRTVADLAGEERVGGAHVAEAIQYRLPR